MADAAAQVADRGSLDADGGASMRFRPDVEGLRAVALVAIVAFHVGVPGFGGGYVGVDVFLVISGYLITRQLVEGAERDGRVRLVSFFGRRARRILPASCAVLVATLAAGRLLLAPLEQVRLVDDARAAALFWLNVRFARQEAGYFAEADASPIQHYWSLSLEEQFYVLWPAALAVVVVLLAARRRGEADGHPDATSSGALRRRGLPVLLGVVGVASFAAAVVGADRDPVGAYYLLPMRAWEFVVGASLVLAVPRWSTWPRAVGAGRWLRRAGLAAIVLAVASYTATTGVPGAPALLPVLGAAAVVLAGALPDGPAPTALAAPPVTAVGRHAYATYLVHWPVLVLGAAAGVATTWPASLVLTVVVSAPLAVVVHRAVEAPLRFAPGLQAPRRALWVGAAAIVGVLVASVALRPSLAGSGAAASLGALDGPAPLPADVRPSLAEAAADRAAPIGDGCHVHRGQVRPSSDCTYGDPDGSRTVVLFGDSHAAQWLPGVAAAGEQRGWRVVSLSKSGCPSLDLPPTMAGDGVLCAEWRFETLRRIAEIDPDLVVLSNRSVFPTGLELELWRQGLRRTVGWMPDPSRVLLLGDTPVAAEDVPTCASSHRGDTRPCEPRAHTDELEALAAASAVAADAGGFGHLDVRPWLCADDRCPIVIDGVLVYRDDDHLSATFAATTADRWGGVLSSYEG